MRKEVKLVLFYASYIIAAFIADEVSPSEVCAPGPGFLLFLLLIPISILLLLKDIFKYTKNAERSRLYCILIHPAIWAVLILILND